MSKTEFFMILFCALYLGGCATLPEKIAAADVGTPRYSTWGCERLSQEHSQLTAALAAASVAQMRCRNTDIAGILFVGLPVGTLMGCRKTAEIARLKGEIQALQNEACKIHCILDQNGKESNLTENSDCEGAMANTKRGARSL